MCLYFTYCLHLTIVLLTIYIPARIVPDSIRYFFVSISDFDPSTIPMRIGAMATQNSVVFVPLLSSIHLSLIQLYVKHTWNTRGRGRTCIDPVTVLPLRRRGRYTGKVVELSFLWLLWFRIFLGFLLTKDSIPILRPFIIINGARRIPLSGIVSTVSHECSTINGNGRGF